MTRRFKKFAALLLALTFVVSLNITAAAEACSHPHMSASIEESYEHLNSEKHSVTMYEVNYCPDCGHSSRSVIGSYRDNHNYSIQRGNYWFCICGARDEGSVK